MQKILAFSHNVKVFLQIRLKFLISMHDLDANQKRTHDFLLVWLIIL